jgi:hypothetical protein
MSDDDLQAVEPDADVGAETQARFRYQSDLIVRALLESALLDGPIVHVMCEWHDDYVVVLDEGPNELVSVKHRESSQAPWTISSLCSDGGLKTLFDKWKALDKAPMCRLQTNGGARSGSGQAGELVSACDKREVEILKPFAADLKDRLEAESEDEVEAFLMQLSIEVGLPSRHDIRSSVTQDVLVPLLVKLGIDTRIAERAYDEVVRLVEEASRATQQPVTLSRARLAGSPATAALAALTERKTVTVRGVLGAIRSATFSDAVLVAVPAAGEPQTPNVLVEKLTAAGFGPTGVASARRERLAWEAAWKNWSTGLPGDSEILSDLTTRVLALAGQAEGATRVGGSQYGPSMEAELRRLATDFVSTASMPMDPHHILGLAFDLTEACKVWWSDPFEIGGQE